MKKFIFFACIASVLSVFSGCEKEAQPQSGYVTFYGTVVDYSGNPVPVAEINVSSGPSVSYNMDISSASAVTGSDGVYEISVFCKKRPSGYTSLEYSSAEISVTKQGYWPESSYVDFTLGMIGTKIQKSFVLEKK